MEFFLILVAPILGSAAIGFALNRVYHPQNRSRLGPELGLLTFVLPGCVFVASLAVAWSRRFGLWFCGLVSAHLTLFCFLPFALPSFEARLALFSVNAFPWYPLRHFLNLPVTEYGWADTAQRDRMGMVFDSLAGAVRIACSSLGAPNFHELRSTSALPQVGETWRVKVVLTNYAALLRKLGREQEAVTLERRKQQLPAR